MSGGHNYLPDPLQEAADRAFRDALDALPPFIFVASVQHTGTWFTLNLLGASASVKGRILEQDWGPDPAAAARDARGVWVLHAHIGRHPSPTPIAGEITAFGPDVPIIVPVRDPLAALVTRETRLPGGDHIELIEGFRRVARLEGAFWFPVELEGDREARARALFEHARIAPCAAETIAEWQPRGALPASRKRLHRFYENRDLRALTAALGESMDALRDAERELRPWLESLGYADLMWWT